MVIVGRGERSLFKIKTAVLSFLYRSSFGFLGLSFISFSVLAQDLPDAGSIMREVSPIERPNLPTRSPEFITEQPIKTSASTMTMLVNKYEFAGNSLISTSVLSELSTDFLERPVGVNDLHLLTRMVAQHYRQQGYLARVFLPKQAIDDGIVKIKIVESSYAGIELKINNNANSLRTQPALIDKIFSARQSKDSPLSLNNIERSLLIANDWPGLKITGSLKAGNKEGESGLLVLADDAKLVTGRVSIDNYGSRNTGAERFTGTVSVHAPLGYGERFKFHWLASQGTKYVHAEASMPIGYDGLRLGFYASLLDYRIVNDSFADLDLEGSSTHFSGSLSYPLIRKNSHNLMLTTRIDQKRFTNKASGFAARKSTTNNISIGLQGNYFDDLGRGGVTSAGLDFVVGDVYRENSTIFDPSAGGFSLWRYWIERHQSLSKNLSASVSLNGQRASKSLDSSERFSVGGANSLRAYPVNEGRGSEGDLLNLKLNWQPSLACNCTASALFDIGRVKELDTTIASKSYYYKSIGVESTWMSTNGWYLNATLARRLGNNPLLTNSATDQDGSFKETRIWFAVGKSF